MNMAKHSYLNLHLSLLHCIQLSFCCIVGCQLACPLHDHHPSGVGQLHSATNNYVSAINIFGRLLACIHTHTDI